MSGQQVDATKQGIATVAAVLLVLALIPSGVVGATATDGPRTGQSAAAPAGMSANMPDNYPQPESVTGPAVADRQIGVQCAVDGSITGDDLSPYVNIFCPEAENNPRREDDIISVSGDPPAWAVVVYIEIPDDIQDPKFPEGSVVVADPPRHFQWPEANKNTWESTLNVPEDHIAIVADGTGVAFNDVPADEGGLDEPMHLYQSSASNADLAFPPGVYDIQVAAYLPYEQGPLGREISEYSGKEVRATTLKSRAIANAPKKSASMTIEVGGCRADYEPVERLNGLDELKLEAIRKFFEAKHKFDTQHQKATGKAFLGGFGAVAPTPGGSKKTVPGFVGRLFPNSLDVLTEVLKAYDRADELNFWAERLKLIERRRAEVYRELDRCHGDNYVGTKGNVPGYDPLRPEEIRRAKAAGITDAKEIDAKEGD